MDLHNEFFLTNHGFPTSDQRSHEMSKEKPSPPKCLNPKIFNTSMECSDGEVDEEVELREGVSRPKLRKACSMSSISSTTEVGDNPPMPKLKKACSMSSISPTSEVGDNPPTPKLKKACSMSSISSMSEGRDRHVTRLSFINPPAELRESTPCLINENDDGSSGENGDDPMDDPMDDGGSVDRDRPTDTVDPVVVANKSSSDGGGSDDGGPSSDGGGSDDESSSSSLSDDGVHGGDGDHPMGAVDPAAINGGGSDGDGDHPMDSAESDDDDPIATSDRMVVDEELPGYEGQSNKQFRVIEDDIPAAGDQPSDNLAPPQPRRSSRITKNDYSLGAIATSKLPKGRRKQNPPSTAGALAKGGKKAAYKMGELLEVGSQFIPT